MSSHTYDISLSSHNESAGGGGASSNPTTCPSCCSPFSATGRCQPLILTCGDTFCRRCVEELTDNEGALNCPSCGEVNNDEINYSVNRLAISLISKQPRPAAAAPTSDPRLNQRPLVPKAAAAANPREEFTMPATAAAMSPPELPAPAGEAALPADDVCGGCNEESDGRDLEHCSHCGKAVCDKCKSEHKVEVLEKLHVSRACIEEKLEQMRYDLHLKKEIASQLQSQGQEEVQKIKAALEKAKGLVLDELERRKEVLINEVNTYVSSTCEALQHQQEECETSLNEVVGRLDKTCGGGGGATDGKETEVLSNYDLLDLCQTQINYGKCLKIIDKQLGQHNSISSTMLRFSDEAQAVQLLNTITNYGVLKGSAGLENNLQMSEKFSSRLGGGGGGSMSGQSRLLHRYRTIVGGAAVSSLTFRHNTSKDAAAKSSNSKNEFLCVLKDGRIAVSSGEEESICIYSQTLELLKSLRVEQFQSLKGIASTTSQLVLLLRNSLEIYSLETLRIVNRFFGNAELVNPVSLTTSESRIYVYDQDRDRNLHYITIFDASAPAASRHSYKRFLSESKTDLSISMAATKGKSADENLLLVGSSKGVFLKVYDTNGALVREFNSDEPKIQGRKWRPIDMAVDSDGNVIVLDSSGRKILVFNKQGSFCSQFDPFSIRAGQASHIASTPNGHILVMDSTNGKILLF